MRVRTRALAMAMSVALGSIALGACSSSSGKSRAESGPIKIGFLWEIKGESAFGQSDYQNGAELAVQQINAAGGIDGRPLQATRTPASAVDPQQAVGSFLKAVDGNPSAIIGFIVSTQAVAAKSSLDRSHIPVLGIFDGSENVRYGNQGSEYLWVMNPSSQGFSDAAVQYLTGTLKAHKIGLMGTNENYGTEGISATKTALSAAGLQPVATATYDPTATDLTQQVLKMKGVDGVIDWGYPGPLAVQLKQFQQNGLDVPTMTGASAPSVVDYKLASGAAISKFYAALPCNPAGTEDAKLKAFNDAYTKKYGTHASNLAAQAYDAVYVVKAAIEKAGSSDPQKINQALGSVDVSSADGVVCSADYRADGSHIMNHQIAIIKYAADGTSQTVSVVPTKELPKAAG